MKLHIKFKIVCVAFLSLLFFSVNAQTAAPDAAATIANATANTTANTTTNANCPAILQFTFNRLQDNSKQDLCQYAGKVVLVVNTASFCGFTSQYEGLEALYAKYASRGLVVLGFPSNDFGKQEPGTSKEIADFCYNTYGVKFPMFAKSSVQGDLANPLYVALIKATGSTPKWNFHKYLIDRKGNIVDHYLSITTPDSHTLTSDIEKALNN